MAGDFIHSQSPVLALATPASPSGRGGISGDGGKGEAETGEPEGPRHRLSRQALRELGAPRGPPERAPAMLA